MLPPMHEQLSDEERLELLGLLGAVLVSMAKDIGTANPKRFMLLTGMRFKLKGIVVEEVVIGSGGGEDG